MELQELLFEIQQVKHNYSKQQNSITHLKNKTNDLKSTIYSLQQNFNTVSTCINVYIDTMKQLKTEYKSVLSKVIENDKKIEDAVMNFEQKVPDLVMLSSLQEMHRLELQKINKLELKLQDVEDQLVRFNTPTNINAHFSFETLDTVDNVNNMSPFLL